MLLLLLSVSLPRVATRLVCVSTTLRSWTANARCPVIIETCNGVLAKERGGGWFLLTRLLLLCLLIYSYIHLRAQLSKDDPCVQGQFGTRGDVETDQEYS